MPKIIRLVLYVCITAILLGSISYLLFGEKSVIVETVIPERKTIIETVKATGMTIPTNEIKLSFDVSGIIQDVYKKEGDVVKKGTVLASLSAKEYENKVRSVRAELLREQATLDQLIEEINQEGQEQTLNVELQNKENKKNGEVFPSKKYTRIESTAHQNRVRQEKALVASLQASLDEALLSQLKTNIVAPFDAVIVSISKHKGERIEQNNVAISIVSANSFEVEAKIKGDDRAKVHAGNKVEVTFDTYGKGVVFPALVTRIITSKEKTGASSYGVIITFENADAHTTLNAKAKLSIHTYTAEGALTLPSRFVRVLSSKKGEVSIVEKQGTHKKEIDIGVLGDASDIEILGGLEVDDLVQATQKTTKKK